MNKLTQATSNEIARSQSILTNNEVEELSILLDGNKADNTTKLYDSAVLQFIKWGGYLPTTSSQLLKYIIHLKKHTKPSTIKTYVTAISATQQQMGFESPSSKQVRDVLSALNKSAPRVQRKGDVLTVEELITTLTTLQTSEKPVDIRNRFIILLMLWTGCRTEEIPKFTFENSTCETQMLKLYLSDSKTNKSGEGDNINLPVISSNDNLLCPVDAYNNYTKHLPYQTGPLIKRLNRSGKFLPHPMSERSMGEVVRTCLINAGMPKERASKINGHSFRHTLAENASKMNINANTIQLLGRWKDPKSVNSYTGTETSDAIKNIADQLGKATSLT